MYECLLVVTWAVDIDPDMDPDMALGGSPVWDLTVASSGSEGLSHQAVSLLSGVSSSSSLRGAPSLSLSPHTCSL